VREASRRGTPEVPAKRIFEGLRAEHSYPGGYMCRCIFVRCLPSCNMTSMTRCQADSFGPRRRVLYALR
jgi:hypothetical protein